MTFETDLHKESQEVESGFVRQEPFSIKRGQISTMVTRYRDAAKEK